MRGWVAPLLKLAVFAAVTVTLTALLGLTIANSTVGATAGYAARFTDVTGLGEGDDVRMSGVRVGQVTGIEVAGSHARVRFEVEAGRVLPASTTATVKYRNLIGQRYVSLAVGTGDDPAATLDPGEEIPLARTSPALNLTVLFNGFRPLFEALDPEQVNQLAAQLIQVLQGEGGTIDSVLAHTASLTSTIAGKDEVVGRVVDNLNTVLTTVNDRTAEVTGLIDQLQALATGLAGQRQPIGDAIAALGELTDATAGLLGVTRQPLRENITELGALSKNLADHGDTVDRFLAGLPHKLRTINRVSSYGGWFNYYLCSASGRVGVSDLGIVVDLPLLPLAGTPMVDRCRP